jgi:hypothetical protein
MSKWVKYYFVDNCFYSIYFNECNSNIIIGLNASTGKINYTCKPAGEQEVEDKDEPKKKNNIRTDSNGNIIIYDPYYNPNTDPVYYKSPNIIVPKPVEFPKYNK